LIILGLNAFHADSAAALVRDGILLAAAEEERFRRIKHWAGFPIEALKFCLQQGGITLAEVDHVAINQDNRANFLRKCIYAASNRLNPKLLLERINVRRSRKGIPHLLEESLPGQKFRGTFHKIEHHVAHLSSAFHVSPFDDALVLSVDGFGDFSSAAWGLAHGSQIDVMSRVYFPHSLGIFYQAVTQHLGFPHYGDEYKVMGLAPYGRPKFLEQMRQIVRLTSDGSFELDLQFFRHHKERIAFQWSDGSPHFDDLFSSALEALLGPRRAEADPLEDHHRDLAHSAQLMYEEAFFHILANAHKVTGATNLALAGGCAMNSVANGKIRRVTPFKRVYVQSAAGDAGGAIGAAFAVWQMLSGRRTFIMDHAYWGPEFTEDDISFALAEHRTSIENAGCMVQKIADTSDLCHRAATAVSEGKVVGWFQGKMEWGPRALGNRSIICDPRRADMKAILNDKIKKRESFRPFAPSVLDRAVSEWFEEDDDVPFMMQVFQIRKEKRAQIPAVTHVDGSGRLQTVHKNTNPRYYALIEQFELLTGVPMVLNTSFNENEPLVCQPKEALDCFLRTNMDVLVLGNVMITRQQVVPH